MKNFIDFIADAAKDSSLAEGFDKLIKDASQVELSEWFKSKGYDIPEDECKKLTDSKEDLQKSKLGYYY